MATLFAKGDESEGRGYLIGVEISIAQFQFLHKSGLHPSAKYLRLTLLLDKPRWPSVKHQPPVGVHHHARNPSTALFG